MTGQQSAMLRDAILSGFKPDDLEQMLQVRMNVRMANIIPAGPLATVAFDLINWCAAQGRVGELIEAIAVERPKNEGIQQTLAQLRIALGLPVPSSPPAAPTPYRNWPAGPAANPPSVPPPPVVPPPPPPQVVAPQNVGPLLARVRTLVLALYPNLNEFVIVFEDVFGPGEFASVAGNGNSKSQVHAVVQWANANRPFRLCPLLAAVASQHQNSTELADLRKLLCST